MPFKSSNGRNIGKFVKSFASNNIGDGLGSGGDGGGSFATVTSEYTYTGSTTLALSPLTTQIKIEADGANGAGGANGHYVQGTFPSQALPNGTNIIYISIDGAGSSGGSGNSGGNYAGAFINAIAQGAALVIGAGGGGKGPGGAGGYPAGSGGGGGGASGGPGPAQGGGGGTQTAGGSPGSGAPGYGTGQAGSALQGGNGGPGDQNNKGGGGGGGYFGGGGGGGGYAGDNNNPGGGGGGGSSYINPSAQNTNTGSTRYPGGRVYIEVTERVPAD